MVSRGLGWLVKVIPPLQLVILVGHPTIYPLGRAVLSAIVGFVAGNFIILSLILSWPSIINGMLMGVAAGMIIGARTGLIASR